MLELLTYEPYGKPLKEEKKYIHEILFGTANPPQTMFHVLFRAFYLYYQQEQFFEKFKKAVCRSKRLKAVYNGPLVKTTN